LFEPYRGTDPKRHALEIEGDDAGWKMQPIIPSGPSNKDPRKHVYLVEWDKYSQDENTWERYDNVTESSLGLVKEYYGKNLAIERDRRYGKKKR
jgi:hypothetical protein